MISNVPGWSVNSTEVDWSMGKASSVTGFLFIAKLVETSFWLFCRCNGTLSGEKSAKHYRLSSFLFRDEICKRVLNILSLINFPKSEHYFISAARKTILLYCKVPICWIFIYWTQSKESVEFSSVDILAIMKLLQKKSMIAWWKH